MADTQQGNRLEIRSRKRSPDQLVAFGGDLEITLNGEPLRFWQRVSLDLSHEEFVVAQLTIAVDELHVDADAALILEAAAQRTALRHAAGAAPRGLEPPEGSELYRLFPRGSDARGAHDAKVRNVLWQAGYETEAQIAAASNNALLRARNLGRKGLARIRQRVPQVTEGS